MKKFFLGSAVLFLLSAAVPAFATDMPIKAPVYTAVEPFSWSGLYVGAHLGYGWSNFSEFDPNVFPDETIKLDPKAGFGGGQIGFNWQIAPHWLTGLEIEFSKGNFQQSGFASPGIGGGPSPASVKIDYFGSARSRLGYVMDRSLIYVTGGVAWARVHSHEFFVGFDESPRSEYHVGWTVGGGFEYAFDPHWSAKIEYLYADLGRNSEFLLSDDAITETRLKMSTVKVGLNYRFGDPRAGESALGMPVKAPVVRSSWTGSYIGLHAGYGWGDYSHDDPFHAGIGILEQTRFNVNGWFGGYQNGYNWQFAPNWVFGLETDTSYSEIKGNGVTSTTGAATRDKVDYFGTARGRFGYAMDRTFVYATGGVAWGRDKYSGNSGVQGTDVTMKLYHVGWTAGGGIEYKFDPLWSAKLEYLYADLGGPIAGISSTNIRTSDLTLSTVKFGVNYYGPVLERFFGGR